MNRFRKALSLVALAMVSLVAGSVQAASPADARDYEQANKDYNLKVWARAEEEAAKFLANPKYANSDYFARVVLIQAQAQYEQKKCADMVALLTNQMGRAGTAADQFTYWLAEAQYCSSNYQAAAIAFGQLASNYPASTKRAEAIFSEAEAWSRMQDWARVHSTLNKPDGAFQQFAKTNATNEWVMRGWLLLGEAQAKQNDFAGAAATLKNIPPLKAYPGLEWQRLYLLCNAQLAAGDKDDARLTSNSLVAAAGGNKIDLARSMELQGRILEELDQLPEAIKTYLAISQTNGMPGEQRRGAFLKAVDLTWRLNKLSDAELMLRDYFTAHPELDEKGLETLTRGELELRQYLQAKNGAAVPGATNNLTLAEGAFQEIIGGTNTQFIGKAELNLGWCYWEEKNYTNSLAAFRGAVERLPFSADQAVARFKVGDSLFQMGDFAGAATNYNSVIEQYRGLTAVRNDLLERTLYQLVRTGLEQTNLNQAGNALKRLLEWNPDALLGQPSLLLVGQGLSSQGNTADARKVFQEFIDRFPQSDLLPEVKLAIARTYEAEKDWARAMAEYDTWVKTYTNSGTLPRAEFARAQLNYEAGRETNAFVLLTNFVARYRTSELALKAEYWIGDYYWRQGDNVSAEAQYQEVYKNTNWAASKLQYEALMMAGRAAMMRENYREAFGYFTNLVALTNSPLELRLQALFAAGDARMQSAGTTSATNFAAYQEAIENYFKPIADDYRSNQIAALASGRIGDCYSALAANNPTNYKAAIENYQKAMDSPLADISARSMAECGLAKALANVARLKPVGTQREGFTEAVGHYLNVAEGKNRRANEVSDPYWIKEAGKAAGLLDEEEPLHDLDKAAALYSYLAEVLPSWKSYWNKQLEKVRERQQPVEKTAEKN